MSIFFAKRPKPASSDAPSVIVVNDEETSQKVTEQWTDPVTQRDKEGRAFAEVARLLHGHEKHDTSGAFNDEDNNLKELLEDLSSRFATAVNQESGEGTLKETEEDQAIEDVLIAAIISNGQSRAGDPTTGGQDKALTEQLETYVEHTNIEVEFLLISLFKFWQEGLEQHNRH